MRNNVIMTTQPNPNLALRGAVDLGALAAARQAQEQAAARKTDPTASKVIIDVTEATFETDVIAASQSVPVIVDLWATWCGPRSTSACNAPPMASTSTAPMSTSP